MIITFTFVSADYLTVNHTWNEIYDAMLSGVPVLVSGAQEDRDVRQVTSVYFEQGDDGDYYHVTYGGSGSTPVFTHDPDSLEGWELA